MKITFVIPTYNRGYCVKEAIESVLNQTSVERELVVVNDGSTDNTREVLQEFESHPDCTIIHLPENRGQNFARNTGFSAATGDLVTLLDSDDLDAGADLRPIVQYIRDSPHLLGVFTGSASRSTGKLLSDFSHAGVEFQDEGFLNGLYSGEYQFFLQTEKLPEKIWREDLGVKRSCTLLTWLALGRDFSFIIHDTVTRTYGDLNQDRMGNANNLLDDCSELSFYYQKIQEEFGDRIKEISPRSLNELILKNAYYTLLKSGRAAALKQLSKVNLATASLKTFFAVIGAIFLGPQMVRRLRSA